MAQDDQSAARSTGTVNWFSDAKGYGFIAPDDGGDELFVHQSSIVSDGFRTLTVDEPVEYAIAIGNDGKTKAVDVTAPGGGSLNKKEMSSRGNGGSCFSCGEVGHMAKDCAGGKRYGGGGRRSGGEGSCYVCGNVGHFARDCRQNAGGNSGGGGGGGVECYNCGVVGHMAKDCRGGSGGNRYGGRGYGGEGCYTCGDVGHFAMETLAIHVAELDTWLEFAQARESLVVVVVVLVMNVEALVIWHVTVIVEEEEAVAPVVASVSHAGRKVTLRGTALRLLNKEKEE